MAYNRTSRSRGSKRSSRGVRSYARRRGYSSRSGRSSYRTSGRDIRLVIEQVAAQPVLTAGSISQVRTATETRRSVF